MTAHKTHFLWLAVLVLPLFRPVNAAESAPFLPETTIWFDKPAQNFTQSWPMGNGIPRIADESIRTFVMN